MAETLATLRAAVQEAVNDASNAQALTALNRAYREMVVRARWRTAEKSLGTTVSGTATYALSAGDAAAVQDVEKLRVGSGSFVDWSYVGQTDLWELKGGRRRLVGAGGVFARYDDASGNVGLELYPAPTTSGDAILALVALEPVDLAADTDAVIVPDDLAERIADGAIARLLKRLDEDTAQANDFLASFNEGVDLLSQRAKGRFGEGPFRVQVAGVDF